MKVLITGAAGFIGSTLALKLLERGDEVVGIDNLNDYYDVNLKKARLERVKVHKGFTFHQLNIADKDAILALAPSLGDVTHIVNLAAQAGVRYSLTNPYAYVETNVMGMVVMMELGRLLPKLEQYVYASSSSVYGGNTKSPFSVEDPVEKPISLYAATKRCDELMAYTYAHLYKMPCTGLRFFTVYGPWGRPDMAAYLFATNIIAGKPIPVFNNGNMRRDFTYIDDIVAGVVGVIDNPMKPAEGQVLTRVYNIGNSQTETLMDYIGEIEKALGKKAIYDFLPMQPGDVPETFADIEATKRDFAYDPKTTIREGIPNFIAWYKKYHNIG
ncbi:MAG: NAD-dependent epimerase/dehydratase family protein [Proteobacteria bacterium]|jgi:UDP-glucuronate 4-epimerase|nr:GDP-mannose 4,6-dehydratase [Alphaproteobacteria bacterium]NCC02509.1 NAD-dependent epimerase/dehydratase family protein [Pseudomonadota bacterium]